MLYFHTDTEIPTECLVTFGVNVKPNTDSPIGFFGTGLKYAIAIALRNNAPIYITQHTGSALVRTDFFTRPTDIRGKSFDLVYMQRGNDEPVSMGFTTELGKTWQPWMALRELMSNTMDENGVVSTSKISSKRTTIAVGQPIANAMPISELYIGAPQAEGVEISACAARSSKFYYQGFYVGDFHMPTLFRYNFNCKLNLTEERTFNNIHTLESIVRNAVIQSHDEELLRSFLTAPKDHWESTFYWQYSAFNASTTCRAVIDKLMQGDRSKLSENVRALAKELGHQTLPVTRKATPAEQRALDKAIAFLRKLDIELPTIHICPELETFGCVFLGASPDIFLGKQVFDYGLKTIVGTLLEEYTHLESKSSDFSRAFQEALIAQYLKLAEAFTNEVL